MTAGTVAGGPVDPRDDRRDVRRPDDHPDVHPDVVPDGRHDVPHRDHARRPGDDAGHAVPVGRERDPRRALEQALVILREEARWTRSHSARTKTGVPCSPLSDGAVRWDAVGALMRVTGERTGSDRRSGRPSFALAIGFALLVEAAGGKPALVELTTRGTHAEVLELYDRAIAAAGRRPDENARPALPDHIGARES